MLFHLITYESEHNEQISSLKSRRSPGRLIRQAWSRGRTLSGSGGRHDQSGRNLHMQTARTAPCRREPGESPVLISEWLSPCSDPLYWQGFRPTLDRRGGLVRQSDSVPCAGTGEGKSKPI